MPHAIELCYVSRLHCHWHDEDEDDRGAYRACLECGHVYQTAQELLDAWNAETGFALLSPLPGCAYCGHDW